MSWQPLEIGIIAGCTISPLAFTMAMEHVVRGSKWVVGGERLQSVIRGAQMKFTPSKTRTISIIKGKLKDQRFHIDRTPIPTVSEMPVQSLGRWYNTSLKDSDQSKQLKEETIKGLAHIDKTLPGFREVETLVPAVWTGTAWKRRLWARHKQTHMAQSNTCWKKGGLTTLSALSQPLASQTPWLNCKKRIKPTRYSLGLKDEG